MDEAVKEGSSGDDGGAGKEVSAVAELEAKDAAMGTGGARDVRRIGGDGFPGPQMRGTRGTRHLVELVSP